MTGMALHPGTVAYLGMALVFALALAIYAEDRWSADPPSSTFRAALIALAGAVWPVIAIGIAQLAVIRAMAGRQCAEESAPEARQSVAAQH